MAVGVFLMGLGLPQVGRAAEFDARFTSVQEEKSPDPVLRMKYRLHPQAEVAKTEVLVEGKAIEARVTPYADNPLNETALMVLVDTTEGAVKTPRQATVQANVRLIEQILQKVQPRHRIGLYTFANELQEVAPMGASLADLRGNLGKIKVEGKGTRLYRRGMDAVEKLAGVKAERRALLIFSDGRDEDGGFKLDDLLAAAQKAQVLVLAVGCPETEMDVPILGNLEKLAMETKGLFVRLPSGKAGEYAQTLPADLLGALDGGGDVVASLKTVKEDAEVVVKLTLKDGTTLEKSLRRTPPPPPPAPPAPAVTAPPVPDPKPEPAPLPPPAPPTAKEKFVGWAQKNKGLLALGGVAVLGLVVLAVTLMLRKSPPAAVVPVAMPEMPDYEPEVPTPSTAQEASLAYLVMQDGEARRLALTKSAVRIGRKSDNDIVFANDSVSGHHAEIHQKRDGSFSITDLQSGNGVTVNGKRVTQSGLRNGDEIELGEVRFRFTLS
jgi:hypothetical protein